ncbi:unnamed protein product [Rhodiola kirilowii]
MLKQYSSRNLKGGRGYKVKHVAQMCLILAVTIWMLYQVRHCYFKKAAAIDERGGGAKLGRKGLLPGVMEEEEEGEANEDEADDLMEEIDEQETEDNNQIEDGSFTNTKRNETDKYVKLQKD